MNTIEKLQQLKTKIETNQSREEILQDIDEILRRVTITHSIFATIQEALGDLRFEVKYLLFDLEATRRERDELKKR